MTSLCVVMCMYSAMNECFKRKIACYLTIIDLMMPLSVVKPTALFYEYETTFSTSLFCSVLFQQQGSFSRPPLCLVAQLCPTLCDPIQFLESRPEYWSGYPFPSPGDLPNSGIKHRSPALQADSLSAEPQGKPKNTGAGSLFLLHWIFPTQESNRGLLH